MATKQEIPIYFDQIVRGTPRPAREFNWECDVPWLDKETVFVVFK